MSDLASRITNARFQPVRLREGYDMGDVDTFLDQAAEAARRGEPLAPLIAAASFAPVRLREGYDMSSVDAFLADLANQSAEVAPGATSDDESPDALRARLVTRITDARFTTVRLRDSYDLAQVDAFLVRAAEAARDGDSVAALIAEVGFAPVRLREGYEMSGVDAFLADLARQAAGLDPERAETGSAEIAERERLQARISGARFTAVRLREGYDMGEVDAFLDRLVAAVGADESLGQLCHEARFTPVRMREGYDTDEVDAFLAEMSGDSTTTYDAGPGEASAVEPVGLETPDVVQEQRGLLSRVFGRHA